MAPKENIAYKRRLPVEILFLSTIFVCFITGLYFLFKFLDVDPLQTMLSLGLFGCLYALFNLIGSYEWGSLVLHILLIGPVVAASLIYVGYHIYSVVALGRSPSIRIFLDATLGSLLAYYVFHWLITAYISFNVPENNVKYDTLHSWRSWPTYYEIRDYKEPIHTLTSKQTFKKNTWTHDWYHRINANIKQYIDVNQTPDDPISQYNNRTVVLLHPKRDETSPTSWIGDNTLDGTELHSGALLNVAPTNSKDVPSDLTHQQHNVKKALLVKQYGVSVNEFKERDFEEALLNALYTIDGDENLSEYDIDTTQPVMMLTTLTTERLEEDMLTLFSWRYQVDIEFLIPLYEMNKANGG